MSALWIIAICALVLTARELLTSVMIAWSSRYQYSVAPTPVRWVFRVSSFLVRS